MCRCCAWVQKRVVGTEARTHSPGRSIPTFISQVQRSLNYPANEKLKGQRKRITIDLKVGVLVLVS